MIEQPAADLFKRQLSDLLERQTRNCRSIKFAKNAIVYLSGDKSDCVYYIVSGQIKLLMNSPEGKECLLAIYTAGDIFGEMCLSGPGPRQETATAMSETVIKRISCSTFFSRLTGDLLLEGFIRYLTVRISDQQDVISNLVTVDSEQRLGKTLLQLARKLGKKDPRSIRIDQWISHEELAAMVGTTRPRITEFMRRFRERHLIEIGPGHFIIVKEKRLAAYLDRVI
jgi:CRP/FNR family transcriptional regulator, cyclic AMP receptor protein